MRYGPGCRRSGVTAWDLLSVRAWRWQRRGARNAWLNSLGLCQAVSETKGFSLPASESLLHCLLESPVDAPVSSHLFIATCNQRLAAGAFIIRCGSHIHYFWGATDRELAKARPGEALHWAIIEWAVAQASTLYDLEGIDPVGNPGTYEFKRKLGGAEVQLVAQETTPLSFRGRLVAPVLARVLA